MMQFLQIVKTGFFNSTIPSSEQHSVHPEQVRPGISLPLGTILICGICFISRAHHAVDLKKPGPLADYRDTQRTYHLS